MSFFNSHEEDGIKGTLFLNGREREFVIPKRRVSTKNGTYPVFGLWAYSCRREVVAQVQIDGGLWMTTKATWQSKPGRHTATFKYTPPGGREQTISIPFVTEDVIAGQRAGGVYGVDAFFPCQRIVEPSEPEMRIPEWGPGWEGYLLEPTAIGLPYECACCGHRFLTTEERDTHQLACTSCLYVCPCCEDRFPTIIERDEHQAICPVCVPVISPPTPTTPTPSIPVSIVPIGTIVSRVAPTPAPPTSRVGVQAVALPSWLLPVVGLTIGGIVIWWIFRKKK